MRNEKALIAEAEADIRKYQTEYENAEDALETTKAKVANLTEQVRRGHSPPRSQCAYKD